MPKRKQRANAKGKPVEDKQTKPTAVKSNGKGYAAKKKITLTAKTDNQKDLLKSIKNDIITVASGPPGSGKAQRTSSIVYTPTGPIEIGNLKVGDKVCTPNGSSADVLSLHPQGEKDVYKIYFADGDSVECCEDHLWLIRDKYRLKEKYETDKRLVDTKFLIEKLKNSSPNSKYRFKIDTPDFCHFDSNDVPIDPYLLGCLIGDGGMKTQLTLSNIDKELIDNIEQIVKDYGCRYGRFDKKCTYSIVSDKNDKKNKITWLLKDLGLWGFKSEDKFIPDIYKINSKDIRLSIVQGLMDTDGTVSRKSGMPSYSTSSYKLSQDFKFLIESLGGICVIKEKKPYYVKDGERAYCKINYICHIRYNNGKDLFRLKRKKEIVKNRSTYLTKRGIRKIEKVGRDECICIYIDSVEHLYLTNNFIPTHNTLISVFSALDSFFKCQYGKIIFTRPCIESDGENLGFLPGDLNEKISPYMMPIFDFLSDYMDKATIERMILDGKIITLPLAFMRGTTFRNAFVLLDECQNTTPKQMKMFLTRIGENCKVVMTGDPNQSDIRGANGLTDIVTRLENVPDVGIVKLGLEDVVRHEIVKVIEKKYHGV